MSQAANELDDAVDIFLDELMHLRQGESFLIYLDEGSDTNLFRAIETGASSRSARVTVLRMQAGSTLEQQTRQLVSALRSAQFHAVCELSDRYFYHTQAWRAARNSGARIFSLGGLDAPAFIRCVAKVDHMRMFEFGTLLQSILQGAARIRIRTAKGSDIRMRLKQSQGLELLGRLIGRPRPYIIGPCEILSPETASTFLGGQLAFMPDPRRMEPGTAVIDGYMWPPGDIGALDTPIVLGIEKGKPVRIEGCPAKSKILRRWFEKQRRSIWIEHFCLGFHPRATLRGKLLEAERTYGSITVGMGKLAFHTDGVMTNASMFAADVPIQEDGAFVREELVSGRDRILRP